MTDNKNKSPAVVTRSRKGSLKKTPTLSDISGLILESEARIKNFLKEEIAAVHERLEKFEHKLSCVQSQIVQTDDEVSKLRSVILDQQLQIESHEVKMREKNVIIQNIPEAEVSSEAGILRDDSEKLETLCRLANININPEDMVSLRRLGKRQSNSNRPLKVTLKKTEQKFKFLNNKKAISNNSELTQLFNNKIYINVDNSFLMQKEEYRLRQRLKELKREDPSCSSYIRAGVLYHDGVIDDKSDVRNQIF